MRGGMDLCEQDSHGMIDLTTLGQEVWAYTIRLLATGTPAAATTRAEEIAAIVWDT